MNTQTGQHSRDLPAEIDETSDGDLAALTVAQPGSREGSGAGLGFSALTESSLAGFGVPKRTGTPEPWVRKLADDGMAYFYWNKITGDVSWSFPDNDSGSKGRARAMTASSTTSNSNKPTLTGRVRSDSATSQARGRDHNSAEHTSESDDSGVYSSDQEDGLSASEYSLGRRRALSLDNTVSRTPAMEPTDAERVAQSLQGALAPPSPDLVSDLSHIARDAISSVIQTNQSFSGSPRQAERVHTLDSLIRTVVIAVRNLLYISTPPTGQIPSHFIPRDTRDRHEVTASQALLKPVQRKVTATLSKLVLSARTMEYDSGPGAQETTSRIQSDAEELDRAIVTFAAEVQRSYSEHQLEGMGAKRVLGCFATSYLGLGLVGGGCAGIWKGFGWVPVDDNEELPQRVLGSNIFSEFKTHMASLQAKFGAFHSALKDRNDESRKCPHLISR